MHYVTKYLLLTTEISFYRNFMCYYKALQFWGVIYIKNSQEKYVSKNFANDDIKNFGTHKTFIQPHRIYDGPGSDDWQWFTRHRFHISGFASIIVCSPMVQYIIIIVCISTSLPVSSSAFQVICYYNLLPLQLFDSTVSWFTFPVVS